jgi:ubiquinol-cytochrome c reductase cytochrome b subunit
MPGSVCLRRIAGLLSISLLLLPPAAGADEARARRLLNALGCKGCHLLAGQGGSVGPALDQLGRRLDAAALLQYLQLPAAEGQTMPAYDHLPQAELKILADYLAAPAGKQP